MAGEKGGPVQIEDVYRTAVETLMARQQEVGDA